MKTFKTVDAWISALLIAGFTIAGLLTQGRLLFTGYFVTGGWQVMSMLVHVQQRSFTAKKGKRNIYHWITAVALITMPVGSFLLLLFIAPFMALYYNWICFDEVRQLNQRPLWQLK